MEQEKLNKITNELSNLLDDIELFRRNNESYSKITMKMDETMIKFDELVDSLNEITKTKDLLLNEVKKISIDELLERYKNQLNECSVKFNEISQNNISQFDDKVKKLEKTVNDINNSLVSNKRRNNIFLILIIISILLETLITVVLLI